MDYFVNHGPIGEYPRDRGTEQSTGAYGRLDLNPEGATHGPRVLQRQRTDRSISTEEAAELARKTEEERQAEAHHRSNQEGREQRLALKLRTKPKRNVQRTTALCKNVSS